MRQIKLNHHPELQQLWIDWVSSQVHKDPSCLAQPIARDVILALVEDLVNGEVTSPGLQNKGMDALIKWLGCHADQIESDGFEHCRSILKDLATRLIQHQTVEIQTLLEELGIEDTKNNVLTRLTSTLKERIQRLNQGIKVLNKEVDTLEQSNTDAEKNYQALKNK